MLTSGAVRTAFGFPDNATGASDVPSIQGLQIAAGCVGEVIALPRTDSQLWARRLGIYGHIDPNTRPTIDKQAGSNYATKLTVIKER